MPGRPSGPLHERPREAVGHRWLGRHSGGLLGVDERGHTLGESEAGLLLAIAVTVEVVEVGVLAEPIAEEDHRAMLLSGSGGEDGEEDGTDIWALSMGMPIDRISLLRKLSFVAAILDFCWRHLEPPKTKGQ